MPIRSPIDLTKSRSFFEQPGTPSQRQYEALRAYFLEGLPSAEVARRFGYTAAAFRMLCYEFRRGQLPDFFTMRRPGPREQPKKGKVGTKSWRSGSATTPSTTLAVCSKKKEPLLAPRLCARFSSRRALPPCRGGSMKSASPRLAPPRKPLPMYASFL